MRALAAVAVVLVVLSAMAGQAQLSSTASAAPGGFGPSRYALKDIPPQYLALYQAAGAKFNVDWAVLAGIGSVETNHGRSTAPGVHSGVNSYGCCAGPMQFSIVGHPSTWDSYGQGGNVYDPVDAIPATARYLVASGAPADYHRAIFAYNHSDAYVAQVLAKAATYRGAATGVGGSGSYVNPFRPPAWLPARTDQGVDWIPTRPLPVRAIGDCVVTFSSASTGWPGGAFFTYRLLNGDHAGLYVFTAEHLRGLPRVGQRFRAGQRMATALPGFPWIETGFAAGPGEQVATPYNGAADGTAMPAGKAFARFLRELGAQPLDDPGSGPDRP